MKLVRWLLNSFVVIAGVVFGNYLGDKLRYQITGEAGHQLELVQQDAHGNTYIAANLLLSNFMPGLLLAVLMRPRAIFGFLGGLLASFLLGDRYEEQVWETLDDVLSGGDPTQGWVAPEKLG
jgi:hypothetical protein